MKKICVYTCITGDYDYLNEIKFMEQDVDYICFTNNRNITSNTWDVIYFEDFTLDNHRLSRKIKMLGHPIIDQNYEISVWVDGSIIIEKNITDFINNFCEMDKYVFAGFSHHERDCIYDEAKECIELGKDNREIIQKQIVKYKNENYPKHNGLLEMTVFIKKHNNLKVKKTMNLWFDMVCNYSKRDQLSFCYSAWITGMDYKKIDMNVFDNEWFTLKNHNINKLGKTYAIYYDYGNGFNQTDSDFFDFVQVDDTYFAEIVIPKSIKSIRIDPTDVTGIMIKIIETKNVRKNTILFYNCKKIKDNYYSNNNDSQIVINHSYDKNEKISIKFQLSKPDYKALIDNLFDFSDEILLLKIYNIKLKKKVNAIETDNMNLIKEKDAIETDNMNLIKEIKNILSSKSWYVTKPFRFVSNFIRSKR